MAGGRKREDAMRREYLTLLKQSDGRSNLEQAVLWAAENYLHLKARPKYAPSALAWVYWDYAQKKPDVFFGKIVKQALGRGVGRVAATQEKPVEDPPLSDERQAEIRRELEGGLRDLEG